MVIADPVTTVSGLLTDNWNEVLEFVNNYGGKNANK